LRHQLWAKARSVGGELGWQVTSECLIVSVAKFGSGGDCCENMVSF
jgi:hypothetical protein